MGKHKTLQEKQEILNKFLTSSLSVREFIEKCPEVNSSETLYSWSKSLDIDIKQKKIPKSKPKPKPKQNNFETIETESYLIVTYNDVVKYFEILTWIRSKRLLKKEWYNHLLKMGFIINEASYL